MSRVLSCEITNFGGSNLYNEAKTTPIGALKPVPMGLRVVIDLSHARK